MRETAERLSLFLKKTAYDDFDADEDENDSAEESGAPFVPRADLSSD